MTDTDTEVKHSVIHVECEQCNEIDTVTLLEHPRDSKQHELVAEAHHEMAEEHADPEDHWVEVGQTEGTPEEMESFARGLAQGLDGVDDDAFDAELIA